MDHPALCHACTHQGRADAHVATTRLEFRGDAYEFCDEHLRNFESNWREFGGRRSYILRELPPFSRPA